MNWRDGRRRNICKKIMFTPEEWEQAQQVYERWSQGLPMRRRYGDFARQTLLHAVAINISVTLASDPEVFKAELHHIGVNVNQMARIANTTGSVSPKQIQDLHNLLAKIAHSIEEMEQAKAEVDALQGVR